MIAKAMCEKCKQEISIGEIFTHKCKDHVPLHLRDVPADKLKVLSKLHTPKF